MSYNEAEPAWVTLEIPTSVREDWIIQQAITVLEHRIFKAGPQISSPSAVRDYLRMQLITEPNEVFAVVFLDNRHQVLAYEPMFKGTIDGAAVYPRVVVQRALALNAAAVIFAHQHPSGVAEPSQSDHRITQHLQDALRLIDVRVLDHFIIGQGAPYSFSERGLL